ncbi:MAG: large ribosomal subunit protein bL35 [Phycisphaerales bacterium]
MKANKPHKGVLKRMRVTKTGKVKHKSANSKHLKSVKSPNRLRRLRKDRYASTSEAIGLELLLHRRIRGREQPRTALKRSPNPAASKKLKEAKLAALAAKLAAARKN